MGLFHGQVLLLEKCPGHGVDSRLVVPKDRAGPMEAVPNDTAAVRPGANLIDRVRELCLIGLSANSDNRC